MLLVIMGVSASGKTTIGQKLAQRLEWIFADADDYHSAENKAKMHEGTPLTDADRAPWLAQLHELLENWIENGINGILACSALKQEYRAVLANDISPAELKFVYLDAPEWLVEERAEARQHALASATLVASQFETLEPPTDALTIKMVDGSGAAKSVDSVVNEIVVGLGIKTADAWHEEH
jgi:gluconokinase